MSSSIFGSAHSPLPSSDWSIAEFPDSRSLFRRRSPLFLFTRLLMYYYVEVFFRDAGSSLPTSPEVFFLPPGDSDPHPLDECLPVVMQLSDRFLGDAGEPPEYANRALVAIDDVDADEALVAE